MTQKDEDTEEPTVALVPSGEGRTPTKGKRRSFHNLRRELSEDELSSPGVQKMVMDELDRLDGELGEAKRDSAALTTANLKVARLEERLKVHRAWEIISTICIALGPLFIGLAYSNWKAELAIPTAFGGGLLLLLGVIAKLVKS